MEKKTRKKASAKEAEEKPEEKRLSVWDKAFGPDAKPFLKIINMRAVLK